MRFPSPPRPPRHAGLVAVATLLLVVASSATGAQPATSAPRETVPSASQPSTSQPQTVDSFEGRFVVERHGSGRPMILIPGLSSAGEVWDGAVARYAASYELHVLTLAGFAGVPPVRHDGAHFLEAERDAIIRYVRERGLERPVLIGHSLGGFLAFWVAAAAPDLVGPVIAVDGVPYLVALMDGSATPESMRPQAEATAAMFSSFSADQLAAQARLAVVDGITDTAFHAMVTDWSRTSDPATVGRAVAGMLTTDLRDDVAAIRSPVLLVAAVGQLPADQRDGARRRYEAQVSRVPDHQVVAADARHFVMYDDPDFLFAAMDEFLARHTTSTARTHRAAGGGR